MTHEYITYDYRHQTLQKIYNNIFELKKSHGLIVTIKPCRLATYLGVRSAHRPGQLTDRFAGRLTVWRGRLTAWFISV